MNDVSITLNGEQEQALAEIVRSGYFQNGYILAEVRRDWRQGGRMQLSFVLVDEKTGRKIRKLIQTSQSPEPQPGNAVIPNSDDEW